MSELLEMLGLLHLVKDNTEAPQRFTEEELAQALSYEPPRGIAVVHVRRAGRIIRTHLRRPNQWCTSFAFDPPQAIPA